jgi:hypothetical protein
MMPTPGERPDDKALAFDAAEGDHGALGIIYAQLDAVVVAEREFVEVALVPGITPPR